MALRGLGWTPQARRRLERVLAAGAGRGLPVVFDLDNTLICRDITDVAFATYLNDTALRRRHRIPAWMTPPFTPSRGGSPVTGQGLVAYYEALLDATEHHPTNRAPHAAGYTWIAQAFGGLTPAEIVDLSRWGFANNVGLADLRRARSPSVLALRGGRHAFARPFFYPEMLQLVATALRLGYDVWVVSASNVWTVRWAVLEKLNPRLGKLGAPRGIAPDHVLGVNAMICHTGPVRPHPEYSHGFRYGQAGRCLGVGRALPEPWRRATLRA